MRKCLCGHNLGTVGLIDAPGAAGTQCNAEPCTFPSRRRYSTMDKVRSLLPALALVIASSSAHSTAAAAAAAATAGPCDGAGACSAVGSSCRVISVGTIADCTTASSASCVTGLCLLERPGAGWASDAAPVAVVAIEGATRIVGSSPAVWQPRTVPVTLRTFVSGCNSSAGATTVAEEAPSVHATTYMSNETTIRYTMACSSGLTLQVQETFGLGVNGSTLWETTLSSTDSTLWSAEVGHDYWFGFHTAAPPRGWFPGAGGKKFYPRAGFSPFEPWSMAEGPPGGTKVGYGSESGEVVTVLGMGSVLYIEQDTQVSFVQNPAAFPYLAGLGLCGKQSGASKTNHCPIIDLPSFDAYRFSKTSLGAHCSRQEDSEMSFCNAPNQ